MTHEELDSSECLLIGGLQPLVHIRWIARKDVWDEVVSNAFNDVRVARTLSVKVVRVRKNASFLYATCGVRECKVE